MKKITTGIMLIIMIGLAGAIRPNEITTDTVGEDLFLNSSGSWIQILQPANLSGDLNVSGDVCIWGGNCLSTVAAGGLGNFWNSTGNTSLNPAGQWIFVNGQVIFRINASTYLDFSNATGTQYFRIHPHSDSTFTVYDNHDFRIEGVGVGGTDIMLEMKNDGNLDLTNNITINSEVILPGTANCDTIDTNANGLISCGTDADTTYSDGNGISESSEVFSVAGNMGLSQDADGLSIDEAVVVNVTRCLLEGQVVVYDGAGDTYCAYNTTLGTDTTYSAGNGIAEAATVFSVAGNMGLSQDSDGLSIDEAVVINQTYWRLNTLNRSGTLNDAKWCTYASATGVISCNEDAPAGSGPSQPVIDTGNITTNLGAIPVSIFVTGYSNASIGINAPTLYQGNMAINTTISALDTDTTYTAGNGIAEASEIFSVAGNTALTQDADGLSVTADEITDTELAFNTGQHLTTTGTPEFATINTGQGAGEIYPYGTLTNTKYCIYDSGGSGTIICNSEGGGGAVGENSTLWYKTPNAITSNVSVSGGNVNVTGNLTVRDKLYVGSSANPATYNESGIYPQVLEYKIDGSAGFNFTLPDLPSCDSVDTDANGRFLCGADATTGGMSSSLEFGNDGTTVAMNTSFTSFTAQMGAGGSFNLTNASGDVALAFEVKPGNLDMRTPNRGSWYVGEEGIDATGSWYVRHAGRPEFIAYSLAATPLLSLQDANGKRARVAKYNLSDATYAGAAVFRSTSVASPMILEATGGVKVRNNGNTAYRNITADDFFDASPKSLEKELKDKNKKASDFRLYIDDGQLNISNSPESVFGTWKDKGYRKVKVGVDDEGEDILIDEYYDNGEKQQANIGEGMVWNSASITEIMDELCRYDGREFKDSTKLELSFCGGGL